MAIRRVACWRRRERRECRKGRRVVGWVVLDEGG